MRDGHCAIYLKKKKKRKKKAKSKEEEEEKGGSVRELETDRRETPYSLYDLQRLGGRNPLSQDLKFIYSTRATHGYRQHTILSKISCLEMKS